MLGAFIVQFRFPAGDSKIENFVAKIRLNRSSQPSLVGYAARYKQ
jgi:hypothetical protein